MIYELSPDREETEIVVPEKTLVFCQAKGQGVYIRFDQSEEGTIEIPNGEMIRMDKTFYVSAEQRVKFVVIS